MNFQSLSCCCNAANTGSSVEGPAARQHSGRFERPLYVNPYHLLRLRKDATERELVDSYRRLAIIYHPVRANGDPEIFRAVAAAFETLQSKKTRTSMDTLLEENDRERIANRSYNSSRSSFGSAKSNEKGTRSPEMRGVFVYLYSGADTTNDTNEHRQEQDDERDSHVAHLPHSSRTLNEDDDASCSQLYLMSKARRFEPFTDPYEIFASVFGSSLGSNREFTYRTEECSSGKAVEANNFGQRFKHGNWEFLVRHDKPLDVAERETLWEGPSWSLCC